VKKKSAIVISDATMGPINVNAAEAKFQRKTVMILIASMMHPRE